MGVRDTGRPADICVQLLPNRPGVYPVAADGVGVNLQFVGLANYKRLLSDSLFHTALANVFTFLVIQVPIMLILALILAQALNNPNIKFRRSLSHSDFPAGRELRWSRMPLSFDRCSPLTALSTRSC